jgi:hypothetical protein
MAAAPESRTRPVSFPPGLRIETIEREGRFEGLGAVTCDAAVLRSGRRPMFIEIRNPDGLELTEYRVREAMITEQGADYRFDVVARAGGKMEWQLHEARYRYNTADWSQPPRPLEDTTVHLSLRPVQRRFGRYEWSGFSYQYRYQSGSVPIYQILDRGTWEIGGRAVGNEIWMRNGPADNIAPIRQADQYYSTEWYLPPIANPNILQFHPLQTQLQGFTFTAHEEGILVTWPTQVAHVRTLIEKRRDSGEIAHFHEHAGDLALEFATSPVEVLWFPGRHDFVARANLWQAVFDQVADELHRQAGLRRERATSYGIIEEWEGFDVRDYTRRGLPKLLAAGLKTIFLPSHFRNNMNTFGLGNMCCTVDLKVAESVGEDNLRAFCETAAAGGARVEMWGNTALSTVGLKLHDRNGPKGCIDFLPEEGSAHEALKNARAPYVRTTANHIECDHYSPVFAVMNLRDPAVIDYWMRSWAYAREKIGLGGIFLDSSFNLSSDKFHYEQNVQGFGGATLDQTHLLRQHRPKVEPPRAILSQYHAHLDLVARMQRLGYVYCGEDSGVFGTHRAGTSLDKRLASLPLWAESYATFNPAEVAELGHDPDAVFFRGLAYRNVWVIYWDIASGELSFIQAAPRDDRDRPQPWHVKLLRAFDEVSPFMFNRTILPGEQGVVYERDGVKVLWAFQPLTYTAAAPGSWTELPSGAVSRGPICHARARELYLYRADAQ